MLNAVDDILGQVHGAIRVIEMLDIESETAIDITITANFEALIIAKGFEERECLGVFGVRSWCQCLSHETHIGGISTVAVAHRWMRVSGRAGPGHGSVRAHPQD